MPLYRSLQWKLTFSYTLVTMMAALIGLGLPLTILIPSMRASLYGSLNSGMTESVITLAGQLGNYFESTPPDAVGLQKHLEQRFSTEPLLRLAFRVVVVDSDQKLLATWPLDENIRSSLGETFSGVGYPWLPEFIPNALGGQRTTGSLFDRQLSVVAPITNDSGEIVGALALAGVWPGSNDFFFGLTLVLALLLFAAALIVGTAFGWLASRGLTRRLNAMMQTTEAWGRGDFSQSIRDKSGDEIGQLSRRLDQMAEQLQGLFQTREALAATDERNRLARELHDSVKQNVFAAAMQIGAAKALLDQDATAVRTPLLEAEKLAQQARDELTGLIRQLRPAALEDRGLAEALRAYVAEWSQRFQIKADVRVQGERSLPLEIEQALFRVAQEALANAARHSGASKVAVELIYTNEGVALGIGDNGKGFALEAAQKKGIGLDSMRERMEALGGYLQVVSQTGAGAHIVASVRHRTP